MAAGCWQDHRQNDKKGLSERLQIIQNWCTCGTNPLQEKHLHYIYIYAFIQSDLEERNKAILQGANNIRNIQCQVNLTTRLVSKLAERRNAENIYLCVYVSALV